MVYDDPKSIGIDGFTYSRLNRIKAYYSVKLDKNVSSPEALNLLMDLWDKHEREVK